MDDHHTIYKSVLLSFLAIKNKWRPIEKRAYITATCWLCLFNVIILYCKICCVVFIKSGVTKGVCSRKYLALREEKSS